jgi:magnesium-transporting ATPase (P-type)
MGSMGFITPEPADAEKPDPNEWHPEYNGESPDEEALVLGASALGYQFAFSKGTDTVGVRVKRVNATRMPMPGHSVFKDYTPPRVEEWKVLAINPFTSDRKRMSVLYRDPRSGEAVLLCKGADNQMLAVCGGEHEAVQMQVDSYARLGLRTLVVAERVVIEAELKAWSAVHAAASRLPGKERKAALDHAAGLIERDLRLLGLTAVEDRLQEGVPQAVRALRDARINFWLITGDKVETAINISRSAELITPRSELVLLTASAVGLGDGAVPAPAVTPAATPAATPTKMPTATPTPTPTPTPTTTAEEVQARLLALIQQLLAKHAAREPDRALMREELESRGVCLRFLDLALCPFRARRKRSRFVAVNKNLVLVVDGELLQHVLLKQANKELEAAFLHLARCCGVVVACRTSPAQKAQLVLLVKLNVEPSPITLAIGDGANDVPMIEAGHIGVGISGKEGAHAANAADFTIAQFRFLEPLLLVHGRSGYIRAAKAISLVLYGNLYFTFTAAFFGAVNAFSGTPAFSAVEYIVFQAFIALSVFTMGFFDRDFYDMYHALEQPRNYDVGRLNRIMRPAFLDLQVLRGIVEAALTLVFVSQSGRRLTLTIDQIGASLYVVLTFVMTSLFARVAASFTVPVILAYCFNIGVVFVFEVVVVRSWVVDGQSGFAVAQAVIIVAIMSMIDFFLGADGFKGLRAGFDSATQTAANMGKRMATRFFSSGDGSLPSPDLAEDDDEIHLQDLFTNKTALPLYPIEDRQ